MAKILVIDDDNLVRDMICSMLRRSGFEVLEACNGTEGVQKAKDANPSIVLTDILMPDKEGIETILELKANNKDIKIIAMSGGGKAKNMTFLEMAKKVGAQHVLNKPFKPSELLAMVNTLLDS